MAPDKEPEPVTEPPVAPPRLGKGSATEATVEELLEDLDCDSADAED
jgi:hypothetical protein